MPLHIILGFVAMKFSELCFIDSGLFYKMLYQVENQRTTPLSLSLHGGMLLA